MPNGRTGGFVVATSEIARVLDDLESDGIAVVGHGDAERDVSADELRRLLRSWPKDHVIVEEQSHSWYILHLEEWITVDEGTPLFARLLDMHERARNAETSGRHGRNRRTIRDWFRRTDRPPSPLITTVSFEGRYAPGSAGNAFASEMVEELRSAVESSGSAGFIVDLRGLDYRGGDAIASMGTALYDKESGAFRPAAFVATGPTADAIRELFGPNWVLGVAGVKLFESYDEAHEFVMEKIGEEATETSEVPASNGSASPPTSQPATGEEHQPHSAADGGVNEVETIFHEDPGAAEANSRRHESEAAPQSTSGSYGSWLYPISLTSAVIGSVIVTQFSGSGCGFASFLLISIVTVLVTSPGGGLVESFMSLLMIGILLGVLGWNLPARADVHGLFVGLYVSLVLSKISFAVIVERK